MQFELKLELCKTHKAVHHPTKCGVINVVKLVLTVYRRIYCCKYFTLSNQRSCLKLKHIRIEHTRFVFIDIKLTCHALLTGQIFLLFCFFLSFLFLLPFYLTPSIHLSFFFFFLYVVVVVICIFMYNPIHSLYPSMCGSALLNFLVTVRAAPHESVIRTGLL